MADRSAAAVAEAETSLAAGLVFQAYEQASAGLERFPESISLRVLRSLALARTGAAEEAVAQLTPWLSAILGGGAGTVDPARLIEVHHEAWRQTGQAALLAEAARLAGLITTGEVASAWTLARAAVLARLAGEPEAAARLAAQLGTPGPGSDLWPVAARLVAAAIGGAPVAEQVELATRVSALAGADYAPKVEVRRLIEELRATGLAVAGQVWQALKPPTVVVFTGHDLDRPGQAPPRLTEAAMPALRAELDRVLDRLAPQIGYASPSAGANLLFVEAMLARGAEVNLILPFAREDFLRHAVAYAGPHWVAQFERALALSKSVSFASFGPYLGHDMLFRYANSMLHGLATLRAQFLGTAPHLVAVWDYEQGSLAGDAADFIDRWGDISRLTIVDLSELPRDPAPAPTPADLAPEPAPVEPQRVLRSVMFADIIGFARLDDSHIPAYLRLLGRLREQLEGVRQAEAFNSWGDAFFVVMEDAAGLAELALRLRDLVHELGGPEHGFPRRMDVRISLHAGPVYRMDDPFTGRANFWGFDINRAARLEPVTVAGHVYATQPFVALLTTEESVRASEASQAGASYVSPFVCEYVGALPFAKNFGAEPVYHVRNRPGGTA